MTRFKLPLYIVVTVEVQNSTDCHDGLGHANVFCDPNKIVYHINLGFEGVGDIVFNIFTRLYQKKPKNYHFLVTKNLKSQNNCSMFSIQPYMWAQ